MNEEHLKDFECCLSVDKHFTIEPIPLLNCGHCGCKCCLPTEKIPLECKICGCVSNQDFSNAKTPNALKRAFQSYIGDMLTALENQTAEQIQKFKNFMIESEEIFDSKIKYIEEEIDIRVESLKIQLDQIRDNLKSQLHSFIEQEKSEQISFLIKNEDFQKYNQKLQELRNDLKSKGKHTEQQLSVYQENLKKLNENIKNIDNIRIEIEFHVSKQILKDDLLGVLLLQDQKKVNVHDLLTNGQIRVIDLNFKPWDIFVLPNDRLIFLDREQKKLEIYDSNMKHIKTEAEMFKESFPFSISMNDSMELYISDPNKILLTDYDLQIIKSLNNFTKLFGTFFKHGLLYVCNGSTKMIDIYTKDLEFRNSYTLAYEPWMIKVSDSTVCIRSNNQGIYFYSVKDFSLKNTYVDSHSRISVINSYFFENIYSKQKIICYGKNGEKFNESSRPALKNYTNQFWDGSLTKFKGQLLLTSHASKKLIILSPKQN